ncbi:MAG: hypothetical protein AAF614_03585 [Chloroflexota bacterium]
MSRNVKIVLAVLGGLFVLCCCLAVAAAVIIPVASERFLEGSISENPEEAAEAGQGIVDYELPAGYAEEASFGLFGMNMVIIASEGAADMVIMLMQLPAGLPMDEAQMREQMQDALIQQGRDRANVDFEIVKTEQGVVNGEPTVFTTLEGTDANGERVRQLTSVFTAKNGSGAMLMIMGNGDRWDETAVNQFLASIRDDAGVGR